MTKPVKIAVLPVAGLGTRFLPATKVMPKEMLPLVDRPLIQIAVDEAKEAGIEEFVFVSSRGKQSMEDHFDHHAELYAALEAKGKNTELALAKATEISSGKCAIMRQSQPLGLGHAVWCARQAVGNQPFAVMLPDDVVLAKKGCLKQMIEAYNEVGGSMAAVENVPLEKVSSYGVLKPGEKNGALTEIKALVEKPPVEEAPSTLAIIGRYILQPEIFDYLEKVQKGAGGEIQLTDAMAAMLPSHDYHGFSFKGRRFDCGSKSGFVKANIAFALDDDSLRPDLIEFMKEVIEKEMVSAI